MIPTTAGTPLGGRVRHDQPVQGHRTGIEPVLLAAFVAAHPGARVLEGGSGAGAALLCLAARVPGIAGLGLERDPALAALAARNAVENGFASLHFLGADLTTHRPDGVFDHAMANPPWHDQDSTASPDDRRDAAKRAPTGLFAAWAVALARPLRHRGTLSFVIAAAHLPACLTAFAAAGCGSPTILPLWPRAGVAAKLALLRGVKGGKAGLVLHPGLVLHAADGGFTPGAEQVLRGGTALG